MRLLVVASLVIGCGGSGARSFDAAPTDAVADGDADIGDASPLVSIGVTTTGLTAGTVTLVNGGDALVVTNNGTSMFAQQLGVGATYEVTIQSQPTTADHELCVLGGSTTGTAGTTPIAVTLTCAATSGPALRVELLGAIATNGGSVYQTHVAPDHGTTIPVVIANLGTTALHLTLPITVTAITGETMVVRDPPAATIAAGDATTFTLATVAPASGAASGAITIASDDPANTPFVFTVQTQVIATEDILYTLDGTQLFDSTVAGVSTQLGPTIAGGLGLYPSGYQHRQTHAVFRGNFDNTSIDDFFVGLSPDTAPLQNITTSVTGAHGNASNLVFARDELGLFYASSTATTAGPYQIYSIDLSTDTAGPPTLVSGTLPVGAAGAGLPIVSPFGDRIAYVGDFATAGVFELFVVNLPNGTPMKVSAPLTGMSPQIQTIIWAADDQHLIYTLRTQPCAAPQFDLYWVDLIAQTVTQLNAPISVCLPPEAGLASASSTATYGISTSSTHVFFRANEGTGTAGQVELYATSNLGGVLTTVGVNGATLHRVRAASTTTRPIRPAHACCSPPTRVSAAPTICTSRR